MYRRLYPKGSVCAPSSVSCRGFEVMSGAITTGLASLLRLSCSRFALETFLSILKVGIKIGERICNLLALFFIFRIFRKLWGSLPPYLIYARRKGRLGQHLPLLCIIQYTTAAKQNTGFSPDLEKNTPLNEPLLEYVATPFLLNNRNLYRILYVQKLVHKIFLKVYYFKLRRNNLLKELVTYKKHKMERNGRNHWRDGFNHRR
jgi:hypothetical protein